MTRDVESVWEKYFQLLTLPFQIGKGIYQKVTTGGRAGKTDLTVLEGIDGRIRPGTLTCIIAPPGHGKSALLKALTQLLPKGTVTGEIKYGGMTREEANAKGIYLGQMVQYVGTFMLYSPTLPLNIPCSVLSCFIVSHTVFAISRVVVCLLGHETTAEQLDQHLPYLTVRETFEFIHDNALVDPAEHGHPELAEQHRSRIDDILTLLHLHNCADTVVGNDLLRGVSGGEKKRVTVGEGLMTNARVLLMEYVSTCNW